MGAARKPGNAQGQMTKSTEYFRGVWAELKKVHWPTRQQLLVYTGVVVLSVAIVAILMWIVDSALTLALARFLP
ncbi:Protein translocase complex, SecE/Sec61-gamma subunit [Acididesulfobacillus acetoxydans]|uniref:Protein translocase subunit SecE n=1 Tax=Acididesulfobacillus acetoxydans TaxID=1561005 RepID=A0A8S0XV98_9FIRM|nr:preprotein translocase subunit SecE [Acididesulfobacillus acetoxydans]CAA7600127.1 Protein translocase complex, SecE/Sec61-gamma subunit [Acididesulfobacillus acetoxydans]CEJ09505.1 SecE/Sec61-gamma subunits of protein translocation complex [Acididesulfobacillus acetoxydans]